MTAPGTRSPARTGLVALLAVAGAAAASPVAPCHAGEQPHLFSYPTGLDPNGDNWLALRSLPSTRQGMRLAKLGPETLFTEIGRVGQWVRVRLPDGATGWVSARYVACCRSEPVPADEADPFALVGRMSPESCADLWTRRNAHYKAAGYCFHTARGIEAFGNAGCLYDEEADVPLSALERADVAAIRQQERQQGCPR